VLSYDLLSVVGRRGLEEVSQGLHLVRNLGYQLPKLREIGIHVQPSQLAVWLWGGSESAECAPIPLVRLERQVDSRKGAYADRYP
jgi:hypothetical protein